MAETSDLFDRISTHYERWSNLLSGEGIRAWHHFAVEQMALTPGMTVLDVGCGTGLITRQMAGKVFPGGEVTGLDPSEAMLAQARHVPQQPGHVGVQWIQGAGEHLPFADNSYDRITAQFSLRNMDDWAQGLREMSRVLKPGGQLVILEMVQPSTTLGTVAGRALLRITGKMSPSRISPYQWLGVSVQHAPTAREISQEASLCNIAQERTHHWLGDLVLVFSGVKELGHRNSTSADAVMDHVVWAVDGSVTSLRGAEWINATMPAKTRIDIVTVMPPTHEREEVRATDQDAWKRQPSRAAERLTEGRFTVTENILEGDPSEEIARYALNHRAHMIVTGYKGQTHTLNNWAHGVTCALISCTSVPVLVLSDALLSRIQDPRS